MRIRRGGPIVGGANLRRGVLHVVHRVLLEVGVIEQVKSLGAELQVHAFVDLDRSCDTEINVLHSRAIKGVVAFAGNNRKVELRSVKNCSVRPATGKVRYCGERKVAQGMELRRPGAAQHQPVALVELRGTALRSQVELVEIAGALIN